MSMNARKTNTNMDSMVSSSSGRKRTRPLSTLPSLGRGGGGSSSGDCDLEQTTTTTRRRRMTAPFCFCPSPSFLVASPPTSTPTTVENGRNFDYSCSNNNNIDSSRKVSSRRKGRRWGRLSGCNHRSSREDHEFWWMAKSMIVLSLLLVVVVIGGGTSEITTTRTTTTEAASFFVDGFHYYAQPQPQLLPKAAATKLPRNSNNLRIIQQHHSIIPSSVNNPRRRPRRHHQSNHRRAAVFELYATATAEEAKASTRQTTTDFLAAAAAAGTTTLSDEDGLLLQQKQLKQNQNQNQLPPWLSRFEDCNPVDVYKQIEQFEALLKDRHGFTRTDVTDIVKAIYICAAGNVPTIVGAISFCTLMLQLEETSNVSINTIDSDCGGSGSSDDSPSDAVGTTKSSTTKKHHVFVSKDVLLSSIIHYSECINIRYDGGYEEETIRTALFGQQQQWKGEKMEKETKEDSAQLVLAGRPGLNNVPKDEDGSSLLGSSSASKSSSSLRSKLNVLASKSGEATGPVEEAYREIFSVESLRLAEQASKLKRAEIMASFLLDSPLTVSESSSIANLLVSISDDWRALAVRCVASLYRLDGLVSSMPHGTGEYLPRSQQATLTAKDSLRIYASLAQRLGLQRLKSNLESNAFRILYPRQYSAASTLFVEHGMAMNAVSTFLENQLTRLLLEDRSLMYELEDIRVVSRVKEPYSFWKKLLKKRRTSSKDQDQDETARPRNKELSITEVNDGVALRVILKANKLNENETLESLRARERMLCYYVQRQILSKWPATDERRLKDYIKNPKPNGYQSLHHSSKISRNGKDFHFEVQIRTDEMHRAAEFGLAAHWTYKSPKSEIVLAPSKAVGSQESVSIMKSNDQNSAYIEALEEQRANLSKTKCYVFTSCPKSLDSGSLLTVDAGSTVLDVLNELQASNSFLRVEEEMAVYRNGGLAHVDDPVSNGDMLLLQSLETTCDDGKDSNCEDITRQEALLA